MSRSPAFALCAVACLLLAATAPSHAARDIVDLDKYGLGKVDAGALRSLLQFNFPFGNNDASPSAADTPAATPDTPAAASPDATPSPPASASAPTSVSASQSGSSIDVTFSGSGDSFTAEAVPAGGRQGASSNPTKTGSSSPISMGASDGLVDGTTYTFYVTATSNGQTSEAGGPSSPVTFSTGSSASPSPAASEASPSPAASESSPSPAASESSPSPASSESSPSPAASDVSPSPAVPDVSPTAENASSPAPAETQALVEAVATANATSQVSGLADGQTSVNEPVVNDILGADSKDAIADMVAKHAEADALSLGTGFAAAIKGGKDLTTFCHGFGAAIVNAIVAGKVEQALKICSSTVIGIVFVSVNVSVTVAASACNTIVIFLFSSGECTVVVKQFVLNLMSIIISITSKTTVFVIS